MNYVNYLNKISTDVKKIIVENSQIQEDLKKNKVYFNLLSDLRKNTIGYKIKYVFEIDNEMINQDFLFALQVIATYILEYYIQNNEATYFKYYFDFSQNYLGLILFHTNKNYLELSSEALLNFIIKEFDNLSSQIRNKFIDLNSLTTRNKIKILQKENPILLDILCNLIKDKKLNKRTNHIIDSLIKLLFVNDFKIIKEKEIKYTTYKSEDDPLKFLTPDINKELSTEEETQQSNENTEVEKVDNKENIFKNVEKINENLKQLYWRTGGRRKTFLERNDWIHGVVFLLLLAILIFKVPNFITKLMDFSKSSSVIDNILDLATEDLTTTVTKNKTFNFSKPQTTKLETINESTSENQISVQPNEPLEPSEEDIGIITRNIIKNFNEAENGSIDLKSIENRLKVILEETDTKT